MPGGDGLGRRLAGSESGVNKAIVMADRGRAYKEIREAIKTGDIVRFAGKGSTSEWVKWLTRSTWSHVGMALR